MTGRELLAGRYEVRGLLGRGGMAEVHIGRDTRLGREVAVTGVVTDPDGVRISIEDSSTLGGTSRITLIFDNDITTLRRWRVTDPQGYTTTVSLGGIQKNVAIDPRTFNLGFMRPVE